MEGVRISRILVGRLGTTVKAARPAALVTVATAQTFRTLRDHRLQDWAGWLQAGLVDAVCPMAYSPEPAKFAATDCRGSRRERWSRGLGGDCSHRLRPAQTIENIETARRLGAARALPSSPTTA